MMLRMALAQLSTKLGDVQANLEKHLACIRRARKAGAHLIVFPELSLTGYALQDLPTYGMFDEGRFFALGDRVQAFDTNFGRMGMLICEDFWHASPPYLLWLDGADIFLFMSSSPGRGLGAGAELGTARGGERGTRGS